MSVVSGFSGCIAGSSVVGLRVLRACVMYPVCPVISVWGRVLPRSICMPRIMHSKVSMQTKLFSRSASTVLTTWSMVGLNETSTPEGLSAV